MTESMNILGSKTLYKVPLTYKFFALSSALSNDSLTVPGYIYEETCKFTFQSHTEGVELLDFLLLSLEQGCAKEKLKVLKVLKYLVAKGDAAFRQDFCKRDRQIKEVTGFSGPIDPVHGNSLNTAIRNEAEETLRLLFEESNDPDSKMADHKSQEKSKELGAFHATGMGPHHSQQGKYEGFGYTPNTSSKNVVDKLVDGITEIKDKIMSAPDEDAIALINALRVDSGGYQAVALPDGQPPVMEKTEVPALKTISKVPSIRQRIHVPGRAGGGWEDEDDTSPGESHSQNLEQSTDLLESECRLESDIQDEEIVAEEAFVNEILAMEDQIKSWVVLDEKASRCAALNSEKIMELLVRNLESDKEVVKLNIMLVIEILYNKYVLHPDILQATSKDALKILVSDPSLKVQAKSKKLLWIFERVLEELAQRKT